MKRSLKKSLGTWTLVIIWILSLYGGYKIPTMIPQILGVLGVITMGLFSIKKYGTTLFDNKPEA